MVRWVEKQLQPGDVLDTSTGCGGWTKAVECCQGKTHGNAARERRMQMAMLESGNND